jgi:hypothetical protein
LKLLHDRIFQIDVRHRYALALALSSEGRASFVIIRSHFTTKQIDEADFVNFLSFPLSLSLKPLDWLRQLHESVCLLFLRQKFEKVKSIEERRRNDFESLPVLLVEESTQEPLHGVRVQILNWTAANWPREAETKIQITRRSQAFEGDDETLPAAKGPDCAEKFSREDPDKEEEIRWILHGKRENGACVCWNIEERSQEQPNVDRSESGDRTPDQASGGRQ